MTQCLFTVVSFTELETLKGEPTRGQKISSILDKLNLRSMRVKHVGMSRGLGGIWSDRVRLGSIGWFQSVASGLTQFLAHWISSSVFTSLFSLLDLSSLGQELGLVNFSSFGHQHRAGYAVADGKSALNEQMNE